MERINGRIQKASCIRDFHVYQDSWAPILGERLVCKNEPGNPRDRSICCRKYLNMPGPDPGPLSAILNTRNTL